MSSCPVRIWKKKVIGRSFIVYESLLCQKEQKKKVELQRKGEKLRG